ncbi:MAG: restriction endonuclease subunit S [Bacteroidales bacterium]|nr:restriction endonuclease subunit S [Bacteroidales bacterium]
MKILSKLHTKKKKRLSEVAQVLSGVYVKDSPTGTIACLQVKDLCMTSPEKSASHVEYTPRLDNYILNKGDLLFAGKGTTYLCEVFAWNFKAVPSTTLFSIRITSDTITPEYLRWYLNHPKVMAEIKMAQSGSGTPLIHKPTLENLTIVIPDLKTQRIIVEIDKMQQREKQIMEAIAIKKVQITNQILFNELNKQ